MQDPLGVARFYFPNERVSVGEKRGFEDTQGKYSPGWVARCTYSNFVHVYSVLFLVE